MNQGERIEQSRRNLKLSQKDLAYAVGVTAQHISAIEQNKRAMSIDLLVKLASELGTTTDYILTGNQVPLDAITVINTEKRIKLKVKRALFVILNELRQNNEQEIQK